MQVDAVDAFLKFQKVVVPGIHHAKACQFASITWGTLPWAEHAAELREMMSKSVQPTALQQELQPILTQAFDAVFEKNASPQKVKRFSTLCRELSDKAVPAVIAKSIAAAAPVIHVMLHEALAQIYKTASADMPSAPATFHALACLVRGCLISHLGPALNQQGMQLPAGFELVEDAKVQTGRRSLNNTLQLLSNAHSKISDIDSVMGPLVNGAAGY